MHYVAIVITCIVLLGCSINGSHVLPQLFSFRDNYLERCGGNVYNCTVVEYKISSISVNSLTKLLESDSFGKKHKQLQAKYDNYFVVVNMTTKSEDLLAAYQDLDNFVWTRPWWIIRQYPREHVHGVLGIDVLPQMILERVPGIVEKVARALIAQHFPSPKVCAQRPMYMKTSVGSWGNDIIVNQRIFFENFPAAVHHLYVTDTGTSADQIAYIEKSHCPLLVDKHQCAFYPISNCTVPNALTACHERDCIQEGMYMAPKGAKVSSSGEYVLHKEGIDEIRRNSFRDVYPVIYQRDIPDTPAFRMKDPKLIATANNTAKFIDFEQIRNYYTMHWMFNMLYKPNYLLGLQIQDLLQELYTPATRGSAVANGNHHAHRVARELGVSASSFAHLHFERNLQVGTRCIAAHIRMGDRHLNNTDMKQWCAEHTHADKKGDDRAKGKWVDGTDVHMGQWHDMGCGWRQPFGAVRLDQIVSAAQYLQADIKDVLVITDDYHWLHRAMTEYKKSPSYQADVRLHVFPTHIRNVHENRMSLQATAEWWAAIQAARQCEGFIGHRGSAATYAMYWALCF
jgi:hypothetical protein